MALYDLALNYQYLLDKDDYSADDLEALNKLDEDIKTKAINIARYIKNVECELMGVTNAKHAMEDREDRLHRKINSLQGYLKDNLEACQIKEITDCPDFEIKIKKNPPKVVVDVQNEVPLEFYSVKEVRQLDKAKIKDALANGMEIKGARIEATTRIEIK